jgi:hypothetical protein
MPVMLKIAIEYFQDLWDLLLYILGWITEGARVTDISKSVKTL